jgi:hypothetical protein
MRNTDIKPILPLLDFIVDIYEYFTRLMNMSPTSIDLGQEPAFNSQGYAKITFIGISYPDYTIKNINERVSSIRLTFTAMDLTRKSPIEFYTQINLASTDRSHINLVVRSLGYYSKAKIGAVDSDGFELHPFLGLENYLNSIKGKEFLAKLQQENNRWKIDFNTLKPYHSDSLQAAYSNFQGNSTIVIEPSLNPKVSQTRSSDFSQTRSPNVAQTDQKITTTVIEPSLRQNVAQTDQRITTMVIEPSLRPNVAQTNQKIRSKTKTGKMYTKKMFR